MKQNWKKNTAIFMVSQAISILGSSLVQFAITWHITLTTQSGFYATMIIVCGFLPTFFLSPFAGVWADRYNRKKLIIAADAGIALCTLILVLLFLNGYNGIWLLFAAAGIRALGSAVQNPCVNAVLPDIVPEQHLTKINSINGSLQSLIMLVSPMISGVLMGITSLENIFLIDVVTAVLAIVILILFFRLPVREKREQHTEQADYLRELKEGFTYIGKHRYLRNFFIFCACFYILVTPVAFLTQLQVTRFFGNEVWRLTAIELSFSIGMLVGGLAMTIWGGLKNRVHTMTLSGIIVGLTTIGMGIPKYFWLYLGFMGLCGLVMPLFGTPSVVMLQEKVDSDYMGRVFGIMTMLSSSLMPLGMLIFGPLADMIPIEWLLVVTGILMLFMSFSLLVNQPLLKAGQKNDT